MKLKVLKFLLGFVWKPMLRMLLISLTLLVLPYPNIVSVNASVLLWVFVFKILQPEPPELRNWFIETLLPVATWTSLFYGFVIWLGAWGLLGVLLVLFLFAVATIWNNWAIYDYTTTWGARRLFKGSKEDFNPEPVLKKVKI